MTTSNNGAAPFAAATTTQTTAGAITTVGVATESANGERRVALVPKRLPRSWIADWQ